jgi:glycerophosphoryl diester phosphodiesterase
MNRKHCYFILFLISFVSFNLLASDSPLIIGHRGASGYRPEHTLASYELAIAMGADYIEPDLVMTKDGVLMARHENEISETTDVQKKFPERKTTKKIDGMEITGWFIEDFTLKEMKTLRTRDGKFEVPTFREILELIKKQKRKVGIFPETKHPTYFKSISLPLEEALIKDLTDYGLNKKNSPVFIQSFEITNLEKLKKLTSLPLIYLIDESTKESLKEISTIANGIGPSKRLVLAAPAKLIQEAHMLGLKVYPYTFRDSEKEYLQFFELGVDGVFSDFPDHAVLARKKYLQNKNIKKK